MRDPFRPPFRRVPAYKARRQQRERAARQYGGLRITGVIVDELSRFGSPLITNIAAALQAGPSDRT